MNEIKKHRNAVKISQDELGQMIGCLGSTIGNYERCIRAPDINVCRCIVKAFRKKGLEVTLDEVFPLENA